MVSLLKKWGAWGMCIHPEPVLQPLAPPLHACALYLHTLPAPDLSDTTFGDPSALPKVSLRQDKHTR